MTGCIHSVLITFMMTSAMTIKKPHGSMRDTSRRLAEGE